MRSSLIRVIVLACLPWAALPIQAQDGSQKPQVVKEVALSLTEPTGVSLTVEPGKYQVKLSDLAPGAEYLYREERIRVNPPKIERASIASSGCAPLQQKILHFRDVMDESGVAAERRILEATLAGDVSGCPELVAEAQALIAKTEKSLGPFEVTAEHGIALTILRTTDPPRSWRIELLPERQRYFFSYGFNAFPDQDEEYFAKPAGNDDAGKPQFTITRKRDDEELDVSPSVLLTVVPWDSWLHDKWSFGLSAGAGFDGEVTEPEIYLGPSLVIWDNIFLTAGALLHPQKRLLGEIPLTEPVPTAFTDDQLHHTTHDWNWFAGISFRFGRPDKEKGAKAVVEDPKPAEENKRSKGGAAKDSQPGS